MFAISEHSIAHCSRNNDLCTKSKPIVRLRKKKLLFVSQSFRNLFSQFVSSRIPIDFRRKN